MHSLFFFFCFFLPGVNHNLHGSAHGETNHNYNYSYSLIMHMAFV